MIGHYADFQALLREAYIEDDPSVGITSPWFNLIRTSENAWVLQGSDGDFLVSMIPIRAAITDTFKQGRQEGAMDAYDDNQEREERLLNTVDELQHEVKKLQEALNDAEKELDDIHIENCEVCT